MKGVSVVICCYNSAPRLPQTLKHLSRQKVPDHIKWEVIIVNNLSTDNTVEVAESEWSKYMQHDIRLKIAGQPVAGLSFAREKGTQISDYEYIIFCDDDNWLNENYIKNAFELLEQRPSVAIVGGYGIPETEVAPPEWVNRDSSYYATGPQSRQNGIMTEPSPYVYGAGAVVRKAALERLGALNFTPLATDRVNKKLSSGGDVELCYALKLLDYDIAYSGDLKFHHFIPKDRLTAEYLLSLVYQFGYCNVVHRPYFWLFNPMLPGFKKTWWWTLLISVNIYLNAVFCIIKAQDTLDRFPCKINVRHAKGRLAGILKLTK